MRRLNQSFLPLGKASWLATSAFMTNWIQGLQIVICFLYTILVCKKAQITLCQSGCNSKLWFVAEVTREVVGHAERKGCMNEPKAPSSFFIMKKWALTNKSHAQMLVFKVLLVFCSILLLKQPIVTANQTFYKTKLSLLLYLHTFLCGLSSRPSRNDATSSSS